MCNLSLDPFFSHVHEAFERLEQESRVIWTHLDICACQTHEKKSLTRTPILVMSIETYFWATDNLFFGKLFIKRQRRDLARCFVKKVFGKHEN